MVRMPDLSFTNVIISSLHNSITVRIQFLVFIQGKGMPMTTRTNINSNLALQIFLG